VDLLTRVVADAVAEGLMARAGAARGDEKPASGELATDEPLADWERELLGGASAAEATPAEATADVAPAAEAIEANPEALPAEEATTQA
jgi:small subunit ribosomal protein S2